VEAGAIGQLDPIDAGQIAGLITPEADRHRPGTQHGFCRFQALGLRTCTARRLKQGRRLVSGYGTTSISVGQFSVGANNQNYAPGTDQRTRAVQRRRAGRAQAEDNQARWQHITW
jgi:hypothetical protein